VLSRVKPYVILALASVLYYSGALWLYQVLVGRPFGIILNYHRILVPTEQEYRLLPAMFVSPEIFSLHLRYLAAHYRVVTMRQLMKERSAGKSADKPWCVITFDDGWLDNYQQAFPLLRQYQLPATLFVSTDFIGTNRAPWFYELLWSLSALTDDLEGSQVTTDELAARDLPTAVMEWVRLPATQRLAAMEQTIETLKQLPVSQLATTVDSLSEITRKRARSGSQTVPAMLTWDQVREMHRGGVEIGSHGVTHWILTRLAEAQLEKEIVESKKRIEYEVGDDVAGLSYPNGDYSEDIVRMVDKSGYRYACTIQPGYVGYDESPYTMRRLLLHGENTYTTALFACHLAGLFNRGRE